MTRAGRAHHHIKYLERAIAHMKGHQGVWFATGSEIIDAYQSSV
jgi:hypothetical protein